MKNSFDVTMEVHRIFKEPAKWICNMMHLQPASLKGYLIASSSYSDIFKIILTIFLSFFFWGRGVGQFFCFSVNLLIKCFMFIIFIFSFYCFTFVNIKFQFLLVNLVTQKMRIHLTFYLLNIQFSSEFYIISKFNNLGHL